MSLLSISEYSATVLLSPVSNRISNSCILHYPHQFVENIIVFRHLVEIDFASTSIAPTKQNIRPNLILRFNSICSTSRISSNVENGFDVCIIEVHDEVDEVRFLAFDASIVFRTIVDDPFLPIWLSAYQTQQYDSHHYLHH
jgi:hypothetical protein